MSRETSGHGEPTRREYVTYSGVAVGGGLLAGCAGGTGSDRTPTDTEGPTPDTAGYSATMGPVGTVEFESVPEAWVAFTGDYADMGVALGHGEGLAAVGVRDRFASHLYADLPGVSVDGDALPELYQDGTGKESFYEIDADLHVVDPNFVINRLGWSRDDVDEIAANVAPFLGNTIFTRVYDWHDYEYYSLYEAFEKLAAVFRERDRYEAFAAYHDEVVEAVRSRRPSTTLDIAILYPAEVPPESFYPYLVGEGTQSKQWRDLGVNDALAANGVTDAQAGGGTIDYEILLDVNPDAIAVRIEGEITDEYFRENVVDHLRRHEVASELAAVRNDRVFYAGGTYQGPIVHLFQLERAANGLYPEEFADERLFDRQRVADIVNGAF